MRRFPLRAALKCAVILVAVTVSAHARNCSTSKEFDLRHSQVLAGALEDPSGAVLSGIELELLSAKKVFGTSGRTIWEGTTLGKSLQESIGFALTMGAMLCVRPKCGAEPTDVVSSAG